MSSNNKETLSKSVPKTIYCSSIIYIIPLIWVIIFSVKNPVSNYVLGLFIWAGWWNSIWSCLILIILPLIFFFLIYYYNIIRLKRRILKNISEKNKNFRRVETGQIEIKHGHIEDKIISIIITSLISLIIAIIAMIIVYPVDFETFEFSIYGINYYMMWSFLYILLYFETIDFLAKLLESKKINNEKKVKKWFNRVHLIIEDFILSVVITLIFFYGFWEMGVIEDLFQFWFIYVPLDIFYLVILAITCKILNEYKIKISDKFLENNSAVE
ncbi:MAG: hypothetical protein ACTSRP_23735 [Candidatus Helarchaeota archaeon]